MIYGNYFFPFIERAKLVLIVLINIGDMGGRSFLNRRSIFFVIAGRDVPANTN